MTNDAAPTTPDELRFQFGKNWARFLELLDDERVAEAERSLTEMLEVADLREHSFPDSVACTHELKRRFFAGDPDWTIERGSVLDASYPRSLGTCDVAYAWGGLHHTGDMWRALANVTGLVTPGGRLFVGIYNDQGSASRRWRAVKRFYNGSTTPVRLGLLFCMVAYWAIRGAVAGLARLENPLSVARSDRRKKDRGMSVWHDLVDWAGGYPFEVAKAEDVFEFYRPRGFFLRLKTTGGACGPNQFVFVKGPA